MPRQISSGVFRDLGRALGLFGEGAQTTELEDTSVQQVLDIGNIAAASQALGDAGGFFRGGMALSQAAAGTFSQFLDPYNPGAAAAPYPLVVGPEWDLWYFGASSTSNAMQGLTRAVVSMTYVLSDGFVQSTFTSRDIVLGYWDTLIAQPAPTFHARAADGATFLAPSSGPFLWPRGKSIAYRATVTGAVADIFYCVSMWNLVRRGLRPSGLM